MDPVMTRYTVNLPATLRKQTQAVARKMAVSESHVVRFAIRDYVTRHRKPSKQATEPGTAAI